MSKIFRKIIMTITLLLTIILLLNRVNEIDFSADRSKDYNSPPVKLSILPEELSTSLELLDKKAKELKDKIDSKDFGLDYLKLAQDNFISADTPLILQTYYEKSNALAQNVITMPESFIGLSIREFNDILSVWEVKDYKAGQVMVLYRSLDELSPEDREKMHLGVKDGKVTVFYGDRGNKNIKRTTRIEVDKLPHLEQEKLEKGIIIESDEELLSILDGYISSVNRD